MKRNRRPKPPAHRLRQDRQILQTRQSRRADENRENRPHRASRSRHEHPYPLARRDPRRPRADGPRPGGPPAALGRPPPPRAPPPPPRRFDAAGPDGQRMTVVDVLPTTDISVPPPAG